ncbi:MAG: hypothetical protein HUU57_08390 [Bdellovibrio sp.]|nr:hypothetical protein [Bdellovibrio sp.]
MTESMFASLRIVAMMLVADKVIHPLERSWFLAVVNTCGPTAVQRKTLIASPFFAKRLLCRA